jgi:hypothetical protein
MTGARKTRAGFPRTRIENLSLSRLIVGTNWFFGYSHTTPAKNRLINEVITRPRLAGILEVFLRAGVDALYGIRPERPDLLDALKEAEDRVGRRMVRMAIPTLNVQDGAKALSESARILDAYAAIGTDILLPHQACTDPLVDRRRRRITGMEKYLKMIRERGMIPGLSTHMPETPVYADETGLDVATYIQIYNAAGFLMQIEVDWVCRSIWQRKKPVITIKPLAAGRLHPLVGLAFNWATLRPQDMVCVGVMTADEAREVIDLSLSLIERGPLSPPLQVTRSKQSMVGK